ncbi:asparaginase [Loigolactobacillus zhaoyuanensis]|uniref:asparaginase n=1 Tax=Loigolactobacillus zhaoyuanensis TaxID=2486017 RepID=A0ABW8UEL0_9LACO|nr:asparaginase [Loigolactobacillus zhaoyuanensis]
MKHILVLHTGGTIAMSENESGGLTPGAANPLMAFNQLFKGKYELEVEELFNLPSPHMTPREMLQLKNRIMTAEAAGIDGVVITHGTDTLEETAYFLDLTLPAQIPVVITGAMRSSDEIGSDGLYNLSSALKTAASPGARGKGVLVVMNDEVHSARFVTKTHTTNVSTFRTPTFGPLGIIEKNGAKFFQELTNQSRCDIDHVIDHIYLLKAYAGMDGTLFDALNQPATNGLIIEGTGAGNLPPQTLPAIQKLLDRNIPIILVSRCFNGVAEPVYAYKGGGQELAKMGLIFCQGLNGQKARIKLLVALANGKSGAALATYMRDAIS